MNKTRKEEGSGSEASVSNSRSRFRAPKGLKSRMKSSAKRSSKSLLATATTSSTTKSSTEDSASSNPDAGKVTNIKKKSVKIEHHSSLDAGESGIKSRLKSRLIGRRRFNANVDGDIHGSNFNMEKVCEVRSPEDDVPLRPWRLEKAANVQKPKTLHKTGREKKEDSFRQAPRPPAPPADLSGFPKYEFCSLMRTSKISAPKVERKPIKPNPDQPEVKYQGTITDFEIKTAMKTWIWRRTGFKHFDMVRHMKVDNITDRHRYRYKLESFMERRSVRWIKIPYHGDEDQGAGGDTAILAPWEIPVRPTNGTLWEEETIMMPVPGTTLLRMCENCQGRGWIRCWKCDQTNRLVTTFATGAMGKGAFTMEKVTGNTAGPARESGSCTAPFAKDTQNSCANTAKDTSR